MVLLYWWIIINITVCLSFKCNGVCSSWSESTTEDGYVFVRTLSVSDVSREDFYSDFSCMVFNGRGLLDGHMTLVPTGTAAQTSVSIDEGHKQRTSTFHWSKILLLLCSIFTLSWKERRRFLWSPEICVREQQTHKPSALLWLYCRKM